MQWEEVDGASYYLVEIEADGVILYSLKTESPSLPLFLNPGEYRIRISVFNKFEKMASRTDWSPLSVHPSPQPIIAETRPGYFYDDGESISLEIIGEYFDEGCRFFLISGNERVRGYEKSRSAADGIITAEVTFSGKELREVGIWDIAVINPSNKEFVKESVVKIAHRYIPAIQSMTPAVIHREENPGRILIRGENFSSRARLIFEGPSPVVYEDLETYFGEEMSFYLNPDDLKVGSYRLAVENEGGVRSAYIDFTVEERTVSLEEKIRKKREASPLFIGMDYHLSLPVDGDSSHLFDTSFLGFSLKARRKFQNSGIYALPFLRQTGLAAGIHYTQYGDAIADYVTLTQLVLDGNFYYLSDGDFPVNVLLSLGFGSSYSLYFFRDERVVNSLDFSNRFEAALQFDLKGMTCELGSALAWTHFRSHSMTAFNPYFLVGWNG